MVDIICQMGSSKNGLLEILKDRSICMLNLPMNYHFADVVIDTI
jgi:hypothetical protein